MTMRCCRHFHQLENLIIVMYDNNKHMGMVICQSNEGEVGRKKVTVDKISKKKKS